MPREMSESSYLDKVAADMPPGTTFVYLNRPCIVLRYAGEAEQAYSESGFYGLVYEYTDAQGVIRKNVVAPRDLPAMLTAVHRIETPSERVSDRGEGRTYGDPPEVLNYVEKAGSGSGGGLRSTVAERHPPKMIVESTPTIAERVEASLYGDVKHREGDFEAVAADVLGISQAEVDAELARERQRAEPVPQYSNKL